MIRVETQGAVDVLVIDGTLNAEQTNELTAALEHVTRAGAPMVVCDLSEVQLIDSDGLEWLLDAGDQVTGGGGTLKIAGPNPLVADILRISGVGPRFEIFDNAKTGVGSFSR